MTSPAPTALILLSDKRSGSTMIQDELCRHPDIGHVDYSSHTYFETQHWLKAASILDRPGNLYSGGKPYPGYGSAKNARTYMIDTVQGNIPGFVVPEDDRALAFEGWQALCDKFARPVFFEKSPQYPANWAALSLLLEWAEQTPMQVKFLFLFRNPYAVQYSAEKLFNTPPETRQFGWLEAQRNLLSFRNMIPEGQQMSLRYEQILDNPQDVFGQVCDFVGVPRNKAMGQQVSGNSLEKWRRDPEFTLALDPAVAQMARHIGYDEAALHNANGRPGQIAKPWSAADHIRRAKALAYNSLLRPIKLRLGL